MAEETIRLGLVGYGRRGRSLLGLSRDSFSEVCITSICETQPESCAKAKAAFPQAAIYADYDEMLATEKLDALIVETPATLHADFCIKALHAGIHVLCDIPCVEDLTRVDEFIAAERASQAIYMSGANPNFWGFVDAFVSLREKGLLGKPYLLEAEYIHDISGLFEQTPWRRHYECIKYCTHSLGPLLRLLEEDLAYVSCFDTGSQIPEAGGAHDSMTAIFRTTSNVVVRLLVSFVNRYPVHVHQYRIFGTEGCAERMLQADGSMKTVFYSPAMGTEPKFTVLPIDEMKPAYIGRSGVMGHGGADFAMLDAFFGAIRKHAPSPIPLREALRMCLPGLYAALSAQRGGELTKIEYPWD